MAEEKSYPMTAEGKQKLEEELENLRLVRRPEVIKRIKIARSYGDLSENWRLGERIRFAFIWPISDIPWLAIHCMGHAKPWLDRDSICMLVCWAFDTPAAVKR